MPLTLLRAYNDIGRAEASATIERAGDVQLPTPIEHGNMLRNECDMRRDLSAQCLIYY